MRDCCCYHRPWAFQVTQPTSRAQGHRERACMPVLSSSGSNVVRPVQNGSLWRHLQEQSDCLQACVGLPEQGDPSPAGPASGGAPCRRRVRHLREPPPRDPSGPDPTPPPGAARSLTAASGGAEQLRLVSTLMQVAFCHSCHHGWLVGPAFPAQIVQND